MLCKSDRPYIINNNNIKDPAPRLCHVHYRSKGLLCIFRSSSYTACTVHIMDLDEYTPRQYWSANFIMDLDEALVVPVGFGFYVFVVAWRQAFRSERPFLGY